MSKMMARVHLGENVNIFKLAGSQNLIAKGASGVIWAPFLHFTNQELRASSVAMKQLYFLNIYVSAFKINIPSSNINNKASTRI